MFLTHIGRSLLLTLFFMGLSWLTLVWAAEPLAQQPDTPLLMFSESSAAISQTTGLLVSPTVTPLIKKQNTPGERQGLDYSALSQAEPETILFSNDYDSGAAFLPPYLSDSDRMGYGKASAHDASVLNAGWYVDWGAEANPAHPGGAEYARTILFHVHDTGTLCGWAPQPATQRWQVTPSLTGTALIQNVQANPGALWIIGNEPDAIFNGSPIQAELYADLYHDLYTLIKNTDPTAKIAIAAIVQPSPLRMLYLDRVLSHYQTTYSATLPVDVWNTHLYILNENGCEWGASEPPFIPGPGWLIDFTPEALLNVPEMVNNLRTLRQWMTDRGYGDKPLIITEYGVLPTPDFSGFSNQVAAQFLRDMSTVLLTTTDPVIGYPADSYRLAQKWAWFSTNFATFGGDLFDANGSLTAIGQAFIQERDAHFFPYFDLQPIPPTSVNTATNFLALTGYVQNRGNVDAANTSLELALIDSTSGQTATSTNLDLALLPSRYEQPPRYIEHTWQLNFASPPTATVPYTLSISVATADANPANDRLALPVNWWPLADLAVSDLSLSTNPVLVSGQAASVMVTATVLNAGLSDTPQTPFSMTIRAPGAQTAPLLTKAVVPPLQPAQARLFTATLLISQSGSFTLSAFLPDPLGPPEITNNNRRDASLLSLSLTSFCLLSANSLGNSGRFEDHISLCGSGLIFPSVCYSAKAGMTRWEIYG